MGSFWHVLTFTFLPQGCSCFGMASLSVWRETPTFGDSRLMTRFLMKTFQEGVCKVEFSANVPFKVFSVFDSQINLRRKTKYTCRWYEPFSAKYTCRWYLLFSTSTFQPPVWLFSMSGGVSEWYYGNHMFHFHCIFVAQSLTLTGFSWRSRGEAVRWSASPATLKVFYSPSDVQAFLKQKIDYNASNYAGNDVDRFPVSLEKLVGETD